MTIDDRAWRAHVESELNGASFDKVLCTQLREGLRVEPLYTETSARRLSGAMPGQAPWVRGAGMKPRGVSRYALGSPAETAAQIAADLSGGSEGFWLEIGRSDASAVLRNPALQAAKLWCLELDQPRPEILSWLPAGSESVILFDALAASPEALAGFVHKGLAERPTARTIHISTVHAHRAGAHAVTELGWAMASAVEVLRGLESQGLSLEQVASSFSFRFAIGRDVFTEIAKLRAARALWWRVLDAAGVAAPPPLFAVAETSRRTLSRRDPWVNALRVTTQVFAAMVGGAEIIEAASYDEALGARSPLGARLARNTRLILEEEAHLSAVHDPAGGSYYVETLTEGLAKAGWEELQRIERAGGARHHLSSGAHEAELAQSWAALAADLAKRKVPVTGVSEFPNVNEPLSSGGLAWSGHREAEAFEALRDRVEARGERAVVPIIALGSRAAHEARLGFARGVLEIAGLKTPEIAWAPGGSAEAALVAAKLSPRCVCLAGSDADYLAGAAELARALKQAGVHRVLIARRADASWPVIGGVNPPAGAIAPLNASEAELKAAGVDEWVYIGADLVAVLERTLRALEVS